ncbi:hypothetical protein [Cellulosimicrobium cellulans]|uniref:hypothetical protein n=1 Tax=Cellulosimicrobium cellulans TaxID=1710 RepID=UPI0008485AAA|nr:hypothetical protein [Cellulosimicrobium cellulans]
MSAPARTPAPAQRPEHRAAARGRVTLARVVASEWVKITSLRSSVWTAVATVVVAGALTYVSANASSGDPGFDPADSLTGGLLLAQVGPLVLGVLVGTQEYGSGAFRTTFTAVPGRLPVLLGQLVATAAFSLVVALLAVAASVVGVLPAAASRGITPDLTADGTPQVLVGIVLYLVGLALLGLAVGALLRRVVPALTTAVVLVLVLPVAVVVASDVGGDPMAAAASGDVPQQEAVANTVATFLPSGAGQVMTSPPDVGGLEGAPDLGALGAGLVLAAWTLVPLGGAAYRLRARDLA